MITDDVVSLMKRCSEQGFSMVTGTADEIYDRLHSLKRSHLDNPVVVGDINPAVAGRDVESKLLKVLEDLTIDVLFFSSCDNFSVTFISRFMQVIKKPRILENRGNSKSAFMRIMKEDISFVESMNSIVQEAPSFLPFFLMYKGARVPSKQKILELL